MICRKCGKALKNNDDFCMGCGTRVDSYNSTVRKIKIVTPSIKTSNRKRKFENIVITFGIISAIFIFLYIGMPYFNQNKTVMRYGLKDFVEGIPKNNQYINDTTFLVSDINNSLYTINGNEVKKIDESTSVKSSLDSIFFYTINDNIYVFTQNCTRDSLSYSRENDTYHTLVHNAGELIQYDDEGNETFIDNDVIGGSISVSGNVLWYVKMYGDGVIICSLKDDKKQEVSNIICNKTSFSGSKYHYVGSSDGKIAYYASNAKEPYIGMAKDGQSEIVFKDDCIFMRPISMQNSDKIFIRTKKDEYNSVDLYDYIEHSSELVVSNAKNLIISELTNNIVYLSQYNELFYKPYNSKDSILIDDNVGDEIIEDYFHNDVDYSNIWFEDNAINNTEYLRYISRGKTYNVNYDKKRNEINKKLNEYECAIYDEINKINYLFYNEVDQIPLMRKGDEYNTQMVYAPDGVKQVLYGDDLWNQSDATITSINNFITEKPHIFFVNKFDQIFYYNGEKEIYIDDVDNYVERMNLVFSDTMLIWLDNNVIYTSDANGENKKELMNQATYYIVDDTIYIIDYYNIYILNQNGEMDILFSDYSHFDFIESAKKG